MTPLADAAEAYNVLRKRLNPLQPDRQIILRLGNRHQLIGNHIVLRHAPAEAQHQLVHDRLHLQVGKMLADAHVRATTKRHPRTHAACVPPAAAQTAADRMYPDRSRFLPCNAYAPATLTPACWRESDSRQTRPRGWWCAAWSAAA